MGLPTKSYSHSSSEMRCLADLAKEAAIEPCVIVMVGLPARGKTYIAKKVTGYLNWCGINTKVFNAGDYRRTIPKEDRQDHDHSFFSPDNKEANAIRERCAMMALEDIKVWFNEQGGKAAIFDATNTTRKRRGMVQNYLTKQNGFKTFFVESVCEDPEIIEANIFKAKVGGQDYQDVDKMKALEDFKKRIQHYEDVYQPIDESLDKGLSFIKIINRGKSFIVNGVSGLVQSKIVTYLQNIYVLPPRTIYLTSPGETNDRSIIEGNGDLSANGRQYAADLAAYIEKEKLNNLRVWTGFRKGTIQTAEKIGVPKTNWQALTYTEPGICDESIVNEEIQGKYQEQPKPRYCPAGLDSCYRCLVARLEPVVIGLERCKEDVVVICHEAIARCLLAYFADKPQEELEDLPSVVKLTPADAHGRYDVEHVHLRGPDKDEDPERCHLF